jgi:hypothetical protein
MIKSDHHEDYIYVTLLSGPHGPRNPRRDSQNLRNPPVRETSSLSPIKLRGLPQSREPSKIRDPALLLKRSPPVFCQGYNKRLLNVRGTPLTTRSKAKRMELDSIHEQSTVEEEIDEEDLTGVRESSDGF